MLSHPQTDHSSDLNLVNRQIEQCRITLKQLQSTAEQATSNDVPARQY